MDARNVSDALSTGYRERGGRVNEILLDSVNECGMDLARRLSEDIMLRERMVWWGGGTNEVDS